jgi:predicted flap endonuclease-1-like 5' DNA nuclease
VLKVPLSKLDAEKPRSAGTCYGQPASARPQLASVIAPAAQAPGSAKAVTILPPTPPSQPPRDKISRPSAPRFFLTADDDIVDAPSIGPKTATRFQQIGMYKVRDLLNANPDVTAEKLATRHIPASVVRDWQDQSKLMIAVPGLRGHDAQILVAAGIRDRTVLSQANIASLLNKVIQVADSTEGKRILRSGAVPDLDEVTAWINAAQQSTPSQVA